MGVRSELPYLERPWEQEAFGLQGDLSAAFFNLSIGKESLSKQYLRRFNRELEGFKKGREEFKNPTNQFSDFNWKALVDSASQKHNEPKPSAAKPKSLRF